MVMMTGCVESALTAVVWANTALAPASDGITTILPAVNISSGYLDPYSSVRISGTVNVSGVACFSAVSDGSVLVWVDDHLVVDGLSPTGGVRTIPCAVNVSTPFNLALPLKIDYIHGSGASVLQLVLNGQLVPPESFSATVSPQQQQRQRLQDDMISPAVPWQTFNNPSMGTHVHMPSGFGVDVTLMDVAPGSGNQTLGNIIVYRRSSPAIVRVGPHSYNGSDYTEVTVSRWLSRNCSITLQSTVTPTLSLVYTASATGADCGSIAMLVTPLMLWQRHGTCTSSPARMVASCPGFPNITVYPLQGVGIAMTSSVAWLLPLQDGAVTGFTTDAALTIRQAVEAVAAAQARQVAAMAKWGPELTPVYEPMQSIIAWNTMFTPYEGVVTPVSRGWDFGSGYVLFDWVRAAQQPIVAA